MKRLIITLVTGLLFTLNVAYADGGFSAGASVGYSAIEDENAGLNFDGNDTGWKIFGLYMFNENFGIEGGYIDFGTPDDTILGQNVEIEADGFDLFAVGALPVSENVDLFGKIGFVSWDADFEVAGISVDSDDGTDLALGFGGDISVSEQFAIRGEFEWFDIDDSDAVWMVSLGAVFRFQ